jgi:hypothetical protein
MTGELFLGSEIMRRGGVLLIVLEGNDEVAIRLQAVINYKGKLLGRAPFAWVETCPRLTVVAPERPDTIKVFRELQ